MGSADYTANLTEKQEINKCRSIAKPVDLGTHLTKLAEEKQ